jgi:hypothetical protein
VNSLITETDDRIIFAGDSIVQHYLFQTGFDDIDEKFISVGIPNIDSFDFHEFQNHISLIIRSVSIDNIVV